VTAFPSTGGSPIALVSVDEHLAQVLASLEPLEPLEMMLAEATGTLLAEEVVAPIPVPPFDHATVDGYAVKVADVYRATRESPVRLPVVSTGPAGARSVQKGLAVRVAAGVPLPAGAEAVVPLEWTTAGDGDVSVMRAPAASAYLRRAGDDLAAGATVLSPGAQVGAVQAALLASVGRARVRVHPRPRVTVVATGDSMLEAGDPYEDGHIYDGVSHALVAACREAGATPYRLPAVRSTVDSLTQAIEDHLIQSDLVLVAGTVRPVGYDPIGEVLSRLGQVGLRRVSMEPGPWQVFGRIGHDRTPVFVLPASPVAAMIGFEVFVRPALRRMIGATATQRPQVRAALTRPITSVRGQRQFVRAQVRHDPQRGYLAAPIGVGSQTLTALAAANALVIVPESVEQADAGTPLAAILLERRGA